MSSTARQYLSIEEVADLLGVNYQLIYRLVRAGELPAARLGRVYRIDRRDLEAYLSRSKQSAAGGVCAACGVSYQSVAMLTEACAVCGTAICADCWTRLGIRHCATHAPVKPPSAPG
jgi:excisionase family DNA binding protein